MLDFGFPELILILAVAVFVIGPAEIPGLMVGLGRLARRLGYLRFAMSQQFEDFMKEADLSDIRKQVNFEAARDGHDFDEAEADEEEFNEEAQAPRDE